MGPIPEYISLVTGEKIPISVLEFATSRSGGPGGQNVNKVETRVEVRFRPMEAGWLSEQTRVRLIARLERRIDMSGAVRVVSSSERTQLGNRVAALERLENLLNSALIETPERRPTRPTRASKARRVETKRLHSLKKSGRRWRPE